MDIDEKLVCFIDNIPVDGLVEKIIASTGEKQPAVLTFLNSFINETYVALNLIRPYLDRQLTFLEVGAGLCFFSLFLRSENYHITALEPVAGGFNHFVAAKQIILAHYANLELLVLDKKAQDLQTQTDGYFDLVFSSNVIEHIPELNLTLTTLAGVLSPKGKMIHGCPNYVVPYEPHLQIPVMKCWPGLSKLVYREKVSNQEQIWRSLNFITYFDIRRFSKRHKMQLCLRKGLTYQAFLRLEKDPYFHNRQSGRTLLTIYKCLKITGLLSLIQYWPAFLSTPMIFELEFETGQRLGEQSTG